MLKAAIEGFDFKLVGGSCLWDYLEKSLESNFGLEAMKTLLRSLSEDFRQKFWERKVI